MVPQSWPQPARLFWCSDGDGVLPVGVYGYLYALVTLLQPHAVEHRITLWL